MPVEPPDRTNTARAFMGVITGNAWQSFRGAGRGAATRALWQGIKDAAAATGLPTPSFRDVNRIRAWAGEQARAGRNFARAAAGETDFTNLIATVANSRDLAQRDAAPRYTVRWQASWQEEGEQRAGWFTHALGSNLPSSVGDLREQLEEIAASGLGDSPPIEAEFTGTAFIAAQ